MVTMYFRILCVLLTARVLSAQDGDHTPVIGRKGTKCYDDFNRPQVCGGKVKNLDACLRLVVRLAHFAAQVI